MFTISEHRAFFVSPESVRHMFFDSGGMRTLRHTLPAHSCMLAAFATMMRSDTTRDAVLAVQVALGFSALVYALFYRFAVRKANNEARGVSLIKTLVTLGFYVFFVLWIDTYHSSGSDPPWISRFNTGALVIAFYTFALYMSIMYPEETMNEF